jgi:hypothetical protein
MKRAILLLSTIALGFSGAMAQVTSVSIETYYTDDASVTGYPANHTTYRIYANCTDPDDAVTFVYGDANAPLILNVTGSGVWNHPAAGVAGPDNSCNLYNLLPALEYDSYVTFGRTCLQSPGGQIYAVDDAAQPFKNPVFNTAPYGSIDQLILNTSIGGAWFSTPQDANSHAGAGLKVLLAQITTDGDICGIFNLQVFPNWQSVGDDYITQTGLAFGNVDCGTPGCTDAEAINFNPDAGLNNGLCLYPCALELSGVVSTPPTCFDDQNGWIYFNSANSQDFAEYSFEGNVLGLIADTVENLANGIYTITAHDTRFDNVLLNPLGVYGTCTISEQITLNTAEILVSGILPSNISCNGMANGCVAASYTGGVMPVEFGLIDGDGNPVQNGNNQPLSLPDPNYCGLDAGEYFFAATDDNGCTSSSVSFVINEPQPLNLFEGAEGAASCFNSPDGSQVITWGGGTGDVDFSANDDGTYDLEGNLSNILVMNLTPGVHMIYGADANGCEASLQYNVSGGPAIVVTPQITEPLCSGDTNGSLTITATGGTGSLQYSFNGVDYSSQNSMADLAANDYTVYVKDNNDCIATEVITVTEPEALTATAEATNISCNGETDGSILITPAGGTEIYAFSLDGNTQSASPLFNNLTEDTYDIYVTDANGCVYSLMGQTQVVEPDAITLSSNITDVSCNGDNTGSIVASATGGTGPFTYSIGGPYQASGSFQNLQADSYTIVVLDDNLCQASVSNLQVDEPTAISISGLSNDNINADPGGNTPYTVTGGTSPYTYEWTLGNTVISTSQDLPDLTAAAQAGTYVLTVTDANGCEETQSIIVTGLSELNSEYSISINPNPTQGHLVMNLSGLNGERTSYKLMDSSSRLVVEKQLGGVAGERVERIDITTQAAGIYYLQITVGSQINTLKVVKH